MWTDRSNCLAPLWADKVFHQAISLGNFCHAAHALKLVEYRAFSGPFDWIFSTPVVTTHILQDDFRLFLDPEHYEPVPIENRITPEANLCEHRFYRERFGLRFMFNHHSPDVAKDFAYFERAVQRFRSAMTQPAAPLLLMVTHEPIKNAWLDTLMGTLNGLREDYGLLIIRFVANRQASVEASLSAVQVMAHDLKLLAMELTLSDRSSGLEFTNSADNRLLFALLKSFNVAHHPYLPSPFGRHDFDEAWYLAQNPDVVKAIASGLFSSGWDHFDKFGRHEGRIAKHG
ncbi:DUF1796 family putative cysteine peptidase [Methylotuvimicrobium buryatense]|uniref:Papain-like cysteine peptidase n=1 Tax=Methylotuvimicrobium buryatense TaxID=95641 RepID=A0A4V1IK84_METBY|nr:DUF1796 family putative cysteine peptidase [Methylotuvimicrobium buryatense]QCW84015.1 hypothetical protein EQU24_18530 [Methylotuvimicrobium buryatense]